MHRTARVLPCAQEGLGEAAQAGDAARAVFKELEAQGNRIAQVGLRIGDRLQVRSRLLLHAPGPRSLKTKGTPPACTLDMLDLTACHAD
jgi:hypothetical protein